MLKFWNEAGVARYDPTVYLLVTKQDKNCNCLLSSRVNKQLTLELF